jgi:hypothetical protein
LRYNQLSCYINSVLLSIKAGQKRAAVGRFSHRLKAEQAFSELKNAGFIVTQISIVAIADCETQMEGAKLSDRSGAEVKSEAAVGAIAGGMLGAIFGWLVSLGMLTVPGVGLLVAIGTTGAALTTIFAGTGIGAVSGSLVFSALAGLEMSSDQAKVVCSGGGRDEFLVIVDGTEDEVRRAESILSRHGSSQVWVC